MYEREGGEQLLWSPLLKCLSWPPFLECCTPCCSSREGKRGSPVAWERPMAGREDRVLIREGLLLVEVPAEANRDFAGERTGRLGTGSFRTFPQYGTGHA